eukprot:11951496-Alexandrium_andersonii.AAC.1
MLGGHGDGRREDYGSDGLAQMGRMLQQLSVLARVDNLFSERRLRLAHDGLDASWVNELYLG